MEKKLDHERIVDILKEYVLEYVKTEDGKWIGDMDDWSLIPVELKRFSDPDICGSYSFGTIYLMECGVPNAIFEIYVHELRHAWQKRTCLWKYLIGKIYRPLIENRAFEEQEKAAKWIDGQQELVRSSESGI